MLASLSPTVFDHHVRRAAEGFAALAREPARGLEMIEAGLRLRGAARIPEKLRLVENSIFSEELIQALISAGEDTSPQPALIIWQRLTEHRLAVRLYDGSVRAFADYYLDLPLIQRHLDEETFPNLFHPPSGLVDRYAEAVAAIDVKTSQGDLSRGSGFIARVGGVEALITCRHNIDEADGISIEAISSARGTRIETGPMILAEHHDVALALVTSRSPGPIFHLSGESTIFDTVYTLGFPLVPKANSVLLGHRGEVNGSAQLYSESSPILIISNLVRPGAAAAQSY